MTKNLFYKSFYKAVRDSYIQYLMYGARSNKKIKPLHKWLGEAIRRMSSQKYEIYFLNGKEFKVEGEYYTKKVDVAIVKKQTKLRRGKMEAVIVIPTSTIVAVISIKFITSNFKQNANNYFESLLGECANLKTKKINFSHLVVFRDMIPYFKTNGRLKDWESLGDYDINKYIKLCKVKSRSCHTPNFIAIEIININPVIERFHRRAPTFSLKRIRRIANPNRILVKDGIRNTSISPRNIKIVKKRFGLPNFLSNMKKLLK